MSGSWVITLARKASHGGSTLCRGDTSYPTLWIVLYTAPLTIEHYICIARVLEMITLDMDYQVGNHHTFNQKHTHCVSSVVWHDLKTNLISLWIVLYLTFDHGALYLYFHNIVAHGQPGIGVLTGCRLLVIDIWWECDYPNTYIMGNS